MNDMTNLRNDCLQRAQMTEQAWRDERQARQQRDDEINYLRDMVCENVYEKCWWRRRYTAYAQQAQNLKRYYRQAQADIGLLEYNRDRVYDRYEKWKAKEFNSRQIIINLQNNPLGNMAEARRQPIYNIIGPIFAKHEQYTGQEPPNEYLDRVWNSISHLEPNMTVLETANVGDFNDAIKFGLLKTKLGGKYIPVPANDPYANPVAPINSPATLRAWMNAKYQRENIGTQQSAIQRLSQERFLPTDSPDTYEKRVRLLLLGVPNNDATALAFLKNHLSGDFYTWMKIANPPDIDAYFTELKNLWLERNPVITSSGAGSYGIASIQQTIETLPIPKKDDFKIQLARDLAYTGIASDDATLEKFIYEELQKRLGRKVTNVRRSPFAEPQVRNTNATKKVVRKRVQKAPVKRIVRLCSVCKKAGHTKINCPGVKRTKKVNYLYHDDVEETEDPEEEYIEEYILEEEEDPEKEEIEEDDDVEYVEYVDDSETRNCNTLKKK
jgi:hypothetical protein